MGQKIKIIFAGLLLIAVFWYVGVYSDSAEPHRTFSVSSEGKVTAVPNIAKITVGVLTEGGKNLTALQRDNTEKANRIIAYLKEQGIEDKDIKTEYYNISPRYQYFDCPPVTLETYPEIKPCPGGLGGSSEIIGYSISQNISVKVRDLAKTGDILAGAVERGANTVYGPEFTIDDLTVFQNQAREEAIGKAREKAKSMAKAGGFKLGKLVSIQEGFVGYPIPYALEEARGGAGPSVEPGSQEITITITLTYEIR